ncbi:MAG TPA: hypothetical protein PKN33_05245 [Phycisphaerae bacterium]|nr:hypothetical protein [Phycisphaerae bacterium]
MPNESTPYSTTGSPNDEGLRCPKCEYNLTGLTDEVCPECGVAFSWQRLPAPIPVWFQRKTIGTFRAFVWTLREIWFHPVRFAENFPQYPETRGPTYFARLCLLPAGLIAGFPYLMINPAPEVQYRLGVLLLWLTIGLALSAVLSAAVVTTSINIDDPNEGRFGRNLALVRMMAAFILLGALSWGLGLVVDYIIWQTGRYTNIAGYLFVVSLAYAWISMSCIVAVYRKSVRRFFYVLVTLPCVVAIGFGSTGVLIELFLGELFTISPR